MNNEKVKGGLNMEQKTETITIRKDTLWKYSTFILLGVVILGVLFYILPGKSTTGNVVQQPGQQLPTGPSEAIEVDIDGSPILGDVNAPVTIVEWTDYECPFCARHFRDTYSTTLKALVEAGEINIITKNYPLPFHAQAQKAAESALCARDQGGDEAYYEMHDLLFTSGVVGGETAFKEYAQQMGLNSNEFASCLSSGKFADEVKSDMAYGSQVGIQGTPGFYIGNEEEGYRLVSGACPASSFNYAIDATANGEPWGMVNCQPTA